MKCIEIFLWKEISLNLVALVRVRARVINEACQSTFWLTRPLLTTVWLTSSWPVHCEALDWPPLFVRRQLLWAEDEMDVGVGGCIRCGDGGYWCGRIGCTGCGFGCIWCGCGWLTRLWPRPDIAKWNHRVPIQRPTCQNAWWLVRALTGSVQLPASDLTVYTDLNW